MSNIILTRYTKRKCDLCQKETPGICFYLPGSHKATLSLCEECQETYLEAAEQFPGDDPLKHKKDSKHEENEPKYKSHNLSLLERQQMIFDQKGLCASCNQPEIFAPPRGTIPVLSVDHCHKTGKVRALLCRKCNIALGLLDEDPEKMLALAEYIKKHQ